MIIPEENKDEMDAEPAPFFSSLWKKPARGSACFVFLGVFFWGGGAVI